MKRIFIQSAKNKLNTMSCHRFFSLANSFHFELDFLTLINPLAVET
jgi:hypothetical protein